MELFSVCSTVATEARNLLLEIWASRQANSTSSMAKINKLLLNTEA